MKISKKTNRICLGLAIAALVAIFYYQVAYGKTGSSEYMLPPFKGWNQSSSWIQLSPTTQQHDYNDQRIEYNILNGSTWHIVNSTDGSTSTVSFGIAPPACGYNGHKYDGRNCSWVVSYWNDRLSISFAKKDFELTFQTVSHNHIELKDQHVGIIHLSSTWRKIPYKMKISAYQTGYDYAASIWPHLAHKLKLGEHEVSIGTFSGGSCYKPHVANVTSCADGFFNAFKHWCGLDAKRCLEILRLGDDYIPHIGSYYFTQAEYNHDKAHWIGYAKCLEHDNGRQDSCKDGYVAGWTALCKREPKDCYVLPYNNTAIYGD